MAYRCTIWACLCFLSVGLGEARIAAAQHLGTLQAEEGDDPQTAIQDSFYSAHPEEVDATHLALNAGGMLAAGNSRTIQLGAGAKFRMRRGLDQLTARSALNVAWAATQDEEESRGDGLEESVFNIEGLARYDRFLTGRLSLFAAAVARHDPYPFQGLDLRLNLDPGVAYHLLAAPKHLLWVEAGYDFEFELRDRDAIAEAEAAGVAVERSKHRHNVRFFLGYENHLSQSLSFDVGIEHIQGFDPLSSWRATLLSGVHVEIGTGFSLGLLLTAAYDHAPPPTAEPEDLSAILNLVYTVL